MVIAICLLEVAGPVFRVGDLSFDALGTSAMKYNSALSLSLCGVSLMLLALRPVRSYVGPSTFVLGSLVLLMGALTLIEYVLGIRLGVDKILYPFIHGGGTDPQTGRISATSAYCFSVAGAALVVASFPRTLLFRIPVFAALGVTVLIVGCFNVVGHLSEQQGAFSWWTEAGIAIAPAIGFALFGIGLLAVAGDEGRFKWSLSPAVSLGFSLGVLIMLFVTESHSTTRLSSEMRPRA